MYFCRYLIFFNFYQHVPNVRQIFQTFDKRMVSQFQIEFSMDGKWQVFYFAILPNVLPNVQLVFCWRKCRDIFQTFSSRKGIVELLSMTLLKRIFFFFFFFRQKIMSSIFVSFFVNFVNLIKRKVQTLLHFSFKCKYIITIQFKYD